MKLIAVFFKAFQGIMNLFSIVNRPFFGWDVVLESKVARGARDGISYNSHWSAGVSRYVSTQVLQDAHNRGLPINEVQCFCALKELGGLGCELRKVQSS